MHPAQQALAPVRSAITALEAARGNQRRDIEDALELLREAMVLLDKAAGATKQS